MQRYLQHGPPRGYIYKAKTGASLDETKIEYKKRVQLNRKSTTVHASITWMLHDHCTCQVRGTVPWYAVIAPAHARVVQLSAWFGSRPIAEPDDLVQNSTSMGKHCWGRPSARRPEISTWPSHRNNLWGRLWGGTRQRAKRSLDTTQEPARLGMQGFANLQARGYL